MKGLDELQRQIELAAAVLEHPDKYSELDLAEILHTSDTSIRRDMKALREMGIVIHSRKRALRIDLTLEQLNQLITTYFSFGNNESIKNLPLIQDKMQSKTLSFFVNVIKAIRERRIIEIEYKSLKDDRMQWRTITPVSFYNTGKTNYLIALHGDTPKMFTIERIGAVRYPNQKSSIKNIPSLQELFRYSWGSFTGGTLAKVRLLFHDNMETYMAEKFWIENQEIRQTDEGFELTLKVKLSNEFIAWVMGWGDAVQVLEPKELKDAVFKKAEAIVKKYRTKH